MAAALTCTAGRRRHPGATKPRQTLRHTDVKPPWRTRAAGPHPSLREPRPPPRDAHGPVPLQEDQGPRVTAKTENPWEQKLCKDFSWTDRPHGHPPKGAWEREEMDTIHLTGPARTSLIPNAQLGKETTGNGWTGWANGSWLCRQPGQERA
jgi:hypothetical protein